MPKHRRPVPPRRRYAAVAGLALGALPATAVAVTPLSPHSNPAPIALQRAAATQAFLLSDLPLDIAAAAEHLPAPVIAPAAEVTASVAPAAVVTVQAARPHRITLQSATGTLPRVVMPQPATPAPAVHPSGLVPGVSRVLDTALSMRGIMYRWGGTTPSGFDCSGLVQYAYHLAGVSLPRTAAEQATVGRAVPLPQIQPGDLIFYYTPISHVAMAIGGGKLVEASQPGQPVATRPIYTNGLAVIRRIL